MIEENNMQVYSEVYGILKSLGASYIDAIPKKIYELINEKRDKTFNPIYDISRPLSEQKISKKTTAFICRLHYNYWCTSDEEKRKINKILEYNSKQNREKYFEYEKKFSKNSFLNTNINKNVSVDIVKEKNNTDLILKKENKWFSRLWKFIKKMFTK